MKVIGLTGPSGAGKSTASAIFASLGVTVLDCDELYHRMLAENTSMTSELAAAFGKSILAPDGSIDRRLLAHAVFGGANSTAALHTLNAITHKYIMAEIENIVQTEKRKGTVAMLLDAPQLFEAGADRFCDTTVAILASPEARMTRIMERDGIDRTAAVERLAAQKGEEFFASRCQHLLYNDGSLDTLTASIRQILTLAGVELH